MGSWGNMGYGEIGVAVIERTGMGRYGPERNNLQLADCWRWSSSLNTVYYTILVAPISYRPFFDLITSGSCSRERMNRIIVHSSLIPYFRDW